MAQTERKKRAPQIISASYRTDIPAFFGDWFMQRVRAKYVRYKNPYGPQIVTVSLDPADVIAVVFWTKNCVPFMKHLDELDRSGICYYFQYSINGQPRYFEERVPRDATTLANFRELTEHLGDDGRRRNLWRYDPVIFSNETPPAFHLETFGRLAKALEGYTERCYLSFLDLYAKTQRNMGRLPDGIQLYDPDPSEKRKLAQDLAEIGAPYGITIYTCAEDFATGGLVKKGSCVDAELIGELFPEKSRAIRDSLNRNKCGCADNRDIGAYDTCPHGCIYCYAVRNRDLALKNFQGHDPNADALISLGENVPPEPSEQSRLTPVRLGTTKDLFSE
jgi:hypothetical protein